MNYIENNSTLTSYFDGSRRLNNIFWAVAVSLGGLGFFLTGLSSYFNKNVVSFIEASNIAFIPQGILMMFYGTLAILIGTFLLAFVIWDIGSGYNEYNKGASRDPHMKN